MLRRGVRALLLEPADGAVCAVRTATGQELRCGAFAGDADAFAGLSSGNGATAVAAAGPLSAVPGAGLATGLAAIGGSGSSAAPSASSSSTGGGASIGGGGAPAVARAVAVLDSPLPQAGGGGGASGSGVLVVFPPHSLPSGNAAAVRVLQVHAMCFAA